MNEELLAKAVEALQAIASKGSKSTLGFGAAPGIQTIFVGREDESQSLWYFLDQGNSRQDIEANTLTGFIKKLEYRESEYKGKTSYKMFLQIDCKDQGFYQIRTGMGTQVELGIINGLSQLSNQDLLKPVSISLRPADDAKLIFANVYLDGKPVYTESRPDSDDYEGWKVIRKAATANVNGKVAAPEETSAPKVPAKAKAKSAPLEAYDPDSDPPF